MKRILFYISLSLLIIGCDTEKSIKPIGPTFGYVLAKMNGEPWIRINKKGFQTTRGIIAEYSSAMPCQGLQYNIFTELYNGEGYITQAMYFIKVPLMKGKYKVDPYVDESCQLQDPIYSFFDTTIGGDVSGDYYKILSSEDNFLQVENYNPKSKEIKGSFQVTFVLERAGYGHTLPDTMRFTDGRFFTKMMDLRRK
jgi:hypothetical protein